MVFSKDWDERRKLLLKKYNFNEVAQRPSAVYNNKNHRLRSVSEK